VLKKEVGRCFLWGEGVRRGVCVCVPICLAVSVGVCEQEGSSSSRTRGMSCWHRCQRRRWLWGGGG
jgi:hypothetical protein